MSKTFIITFQPDGKRVEIKEDQSVLDGAILNGIDITSICGGLGNCGKCKIVLPDHQQVNAITDKEEKLLTKGEITNGVRLACQTKLKGNIVVKIPEYSRTGKQRLQVEGIETPIELNPSV
ncbi:MAG: 2Fe-2S iron-sulfur cluster-binding protein, partial [Candidatus Helarchaeota archaeon]